MSGPAISVVVPCYNTGEFLDRVLASLAAQTLRDFEIIVVDDGSTVPATQAKLASVDPPIRVIRQPNRGLAGARNRGFDEARAPFVLPLDCDDELEPTFLEETLAALRDAPADVGFAFTHVRLAGAASGIRAYHFDPLDQLFVNELPYCLLVRKSAWAAVKGYDEVMRDGYEDWEFNVRLAAAGYRGEEIPRPLFVYTVREDGMLLSHSARLHGTLWSRIRRKNAAAFRPTALWAFWRARRNRSGRISLGAAVGLLALSGAVPAAWLNWLYFRLLLVRRHSRAARRTSQAT